MALFKIQEPNKQSGNGLANAIMSSTTGYEKPIVDVAPTPDIFTEIEKPFKRSINYHRGLTSLREAMYSGRPLADAAKEAEAIWAKQPKDLEASYGLIADIEGATDVLFGIGKGLWDNKSLIAGSAIAGGTAASMQGATIGSAGGLLGAPVGAAAGFVGGAIAGGGMASSAAIYKYFSEMEAAEIAYQLHKSGVSDKTAKMTAAIGGPLIGALDYAQVSKLPLIKQRMGNVSVDLIKNLANLSGRTLVDGLEQSVQEGIQAGSSKAFQTLGKLVEDKIKYSDLPEEMSMAIREGLNEFGGSLGPFSILQGLGLPIEQFRAALDTGENLAIARNIRTHAAKNTNLTDTQSRQMAEEAIFNARTEPDFDYQKFVKERIAAVEKQNVEDGTATDIGINGRVSEILNKDNLEKSAQTILGKNARVQEINDKEWHLSNGKWNVLVRSVENNVINQDVSESDGSKNKTTLTDSQFVEGRYIPGKVEITGKDGTKLNVSAIIELNKQRAGLKTLSHEIYHFIYNNIFDDNERSTMSIFGNEEQQARAFENRYTDNRLEAIWQKIKEFTDTVYSIVTGKDTVGKIYKNIPNMAQREPLFKPTSNSSAPNVTKQPAVGNAILNNIYPKYPNNNFNVRRQAEAQQQATANAIQQPTSQNKPLQQQEVSNTTQQVESVESRQIKNQIDKLRNAVSNIDQQRRDLKKKGSDSRKPYSIGSDIIESKYKQKLNSLLKTRAEYERKIAQLEKQRAKMELQPAVKPLFATKPKPELQNASSSVVREGIEVAKRMGFDDASINWMAEEGVLDNVANIKRPFPIRDPKKANDYIKDVYNSKKINKQIDETIKTHINKSVFPTLVNSIKERLLKDGRIRKALGNALINSEDQANLLKKYLPQIVSAYANNRSVESIIDSAIIKEGYSKVGNSKKRIASGKPANIKGTQLFKPDNTRGISIKQISEELSNNKDTKAANAIKREEKRANNRSKIQERIPELKNTIIKGLGKKIENNNKEIAKLQKTDDTNAIKKLESDNASLKRLADKVHNTNLSFEAIDIIIDKATKMMEKAQMKWKDGLELYNNPRLLGALWFNYGTEKLDTVGREILLGSFLQNEIDYDKSKKTGKLEFKKLDRTKLSVANLYNEVVDYLVGKYLKEGYDAVVGEKTAWDYTVEDNDGISDRNLNGTDTPFRERSGNPALTETEGKKWYNQNQYITWLMQLHDLTKEQALGIVESAERKIAYDLDLAGNWGSESKTPQQQKAWQIQLDGEWGQAYTDSIREQFEEALKSAAYGIKSYSELGYEDFGDTEIDRKQEAKDEDKIGKRPSVKLLDNPKQTIKKIEKLSDAIKKLEQSFDNGIRYKIGDNKSIELFKKKSDIASRKTMGFVESFIDLIDRPLSPEQMELKKTLKNWHALLDYGQYEADIKAYEIQDKLTKIFKDNGLFSKYQIKTYDPYAYDEMNQWSIALITAIDMLNYPEASAKYYDKLLEDKKKIVDKAEELLTAYRGIVAKDKRLQSDLAILMDDIIKANSAMGDIAVSLGLFKKKEKKESYIAHLWQQEEKEKTRYNPFYTKTGRQKQRVYKNGILEGWALGNELRSNDIVNTIHSSWKQLWVAAANESLIKQAINDGILSTEVDGKVKEGHIKIDHEGFNIVGKDGLIPLYGTKAFNDYINRVFKKSFLEDMPFLQKIASVNAVLKRILLLSSLFHERTFYRQYILGVPVIKEAGIKWNLKKTFNVVQARKDGFDMIMSKHPVLVELVKAGMTLGVTADVDLYKKQSESRLAKWAKENPEHAGSKAIQWLHHATTAYERRLFKHVGASLKASQAIANVEYQLLKQAKDIAEGKVSRESIIEAVAERLNNDFGGLNYRRLGWSNSLQDIMKLCLLGHDWTASNTRSMLGYVAKGQYGMAHRALWHTVFAKSLLVWIVGNLIMSGLDDEDYLERIKKSWRDGRLKWMDIDVSPIYHLLGGDKNKDKLWPFMGHFKDGLKWLSRPVESLRYKTSAINRLWLDAIIGEDYAHRKYLPFSKVLQTGKTVDWDASVQDGPIGPSQFFAYGINKLKGSLPVQLQTFMDFVTGSSSAWDFVFTTLGEPVVTNYSPNKKNFKNGYTNTKPTFKSNYKKY